MWQDSSFKLWENNHKINRSQMSFHFLKLKWCFSDNQSLALGVWVCILTKIVSHVAHGIGHMNIWAVIFLETKLIFWCFKHQIRLGFITSSQKLGFPLSTWKWTVMMIRVSTANKIQLSNIHTHWKWGLSLLIRRGLHCNDASGITKSCRWEKTGAYLSVVRSIVEWKWFLKP